ncbi:MAG TPA: cadherin domain-containing protein, partial [Allocoleopsis sp.]
TLARYTADGSLDPTFGVGGKVITPLGISENGKVDIILLPTGKIVAAGTIDGDVAIVRYNANGTLDTGFGGGTGKVSTDFGGNDSGSGVAIQSDGRIIVVGSTGSGDFALARYLGNVPATDILLSNSAIAENSTNQTVVGTLTAIDPDTQDPQTYTLLDDAGGRFALTGNTITVANGTLLDFETAAQHTIRVRTTDRGNASFEKDLTISLLDVDETLPQPPPPNPPTKVEDTLVVKPFGHALRPIKFKQIKSGVHLQGSARSEKLHGTYNSDVIRGNGGNDRIIAGAGKPRFGRDRLFGGSGNDIIMAGRGNDWADGGAGRDKIWGGGEQDLLLGKAGADSLYGGKANDILVGGAGSDELTGGQGRDCFTFNSLTEGVDTITDFSVTNDMIDLRRIFAQPAFAGGSLQSRFTQFVDLVQVG